MSRQTQALAVAALRNEIKAFEIDLSREGPHRDHFGDRQFDVREEQLRQLRTAVDEIKAERVT